VIEGVIERRLNEMSAEELEKLSEKIREHMKKHEEKGEY